MSTDLAKRLEPIVADVIGGLGFDLDAFGVQQVGRKKLVKVVVDAADGIDSDQVASATRAVSKALDEHDHVIAGAYTLEVTSPGLSRPLTLPRHWRRARLRLVKLTPKEGKPSVGRVGHVGERSVRMLIDGRIKDISYASLTSAVVEIEFKQPPAEELKQLEADDAEITKAAKSGGKSDTGSKAKEENR